MNEEEIFHQALARSPEERAAYLDQACQGDTRLRGEVVWLPVEVGQCEGGRRDRSRQRDASIPGVAVSVAGTGEQDQGSDQRPAMSDQRTH